jgi:hypothetical protein
MGLSFRRWCGTHQAVGTGVHVRAQESLVDRIVSVADRIQEVAIEALWFARLPVTWPECPLHPNSHPLAAVVVDSRPMW